MNQLHHFHSQGPSLVDIMIENNLVYQMSVKLFSFLHFPDTQIDINRERLLHSYHNIVIINSANNSINGIIPFLLHRSVYHVDGNDLVPVDECEPPSAINDFPGTIFPGSNGFFCVIYLCFVYQS